MSGNGEGSYAFPKFKSGPKPTPKSETPQANVYTQASGRQATLLDPVKQPTLSERVPFEIDRKGDQHIFQYGGKLDAGSVPIFIRTTQSVLGVDPRVRIRPSKSEQNIFHLLPQSTLPSPRKDRWYQVDPNPVKCPPKNTISLDGTAEYVEFEEEKEDDALLPPTQTDLLMEKKQKLVSLLDCNPKDEETWLAFLNLQDELFPRETNKTSRAGIERKVAIYERALGHLPQSINLLLGYLQCYSEILPPKEALQLWEKSLVKVPHRWQLHHAYIEFYQTRCFSLFTMDQCIDMYADLVSHQSRHFPLYDDIAEGKLVREDHHSSGIIKSKALFLATFLARVLRLLSLSHHWQRAVAILLANLYCNDLRSSVSFDLARIHLAREWDRFAEENLSWPESPQQEPQAVDNDLIRTWLAMERQRQYYRATGEEEMEIVLWEDIEAFVLDFRSDPAIIGDLVRFFFSECGLIFPSRFDALLASSSSIRRCHFPLHTPWTRLSIHEGRIVPFHVQFKGQSPWQSSKGTSPLEGLARILSPQDYLIFQMASQPNKDFEACIKRRLASSSNSIKDQLDWHALIMLHRVEGRLGEAERIAQRLLTMLPKDELQMRLLVGRELLEMLLKRTGRSNEARSACLLILAEQTELTSATLLRWRPILEANGLSGRLVLLSMEYLLNAHTLIRRLLGSGQEEGEEEYIAQVISLLSLAIKEDRRILVDLRKICLEQESTIQPSVRLLVALLLDDQAMVARALKMIVERAKVADLPFILSYTGEVWAGEPNRIRSMLHKLQRDLPSTSTLLLTANLFNDLSHDGDGLRAKSTLYGLVQRAPYLKETIMMGMEELYRRKHLSQSECIELINVMEEKGVRICVLVEEAISLLSS